MSAAGTGNTACRTDDQRDRLRPLRLGLSVGHFSGSCGSIGPFVRGPSGAIGFLSTATALAPQKARVGEFIHQPSPVDIALTGETRAASLSNLIVRPDDAGTMSGLVLDAAVAWLNPDVMHEGNVWPPGAHATGRPIQLLAVGPALGDAVALAGRTTGYAEGRITALHMGPLTVRLERGRSEFTDCIAVAASSGPFSRPGDTGALVWRVSDGAAIGIVFASEPSIGETRESPATFVLPLAPILERFQVSLL